MPTVETPEQIAQQAQQKVEEQKQQVAAEASAQAKLQAMEAQLKEREAALKVAQEREEKAKSYLVRMVSSMQQPEAEPVPQGAQPGVEDLREQLKQRLAEAPEEVLDAHFQARMRPLQEESHKRIADLNKRDFIQRNPDLWNKYGKEVESFLEPMSMETRAAPDAYEQALRYVRMGHIDEEVEARVKQLVEKQMREANGEALEPGSSSAPVRTKTRGLSALEKQIARDMGISEEDWIKSGGGQATREE